MATLQHWELAAPGCLVAPPSHQPACDALLESLIARGYAVISGPKWVENDGALEAFWAAPAQERAALQPLQPVEGCGYQALSDDRERLEYRAGPWLAEAAVLDSLQQASGALDSAARQLLCAALRGRLLRLPGSALAPALDDLPLPSHTWASASLQCFSYGPDSSGCEAHVDKGLLTVIWAPGQPGLEVQGARGVWTAVPPFTSQQLLVLPGHTLEYATCGLVKAANHRVVLGQGQARRCLVYKLSANHAATIHLRPALLAAGHNLAGAMADRYPQPASVQSILQGFDATHRSVNPSRQAGRQAQSPAAAAVRAAAAAAPPAAASAAAGLQLQRPQKRARALPSALPVTAALAAPAAATRALAALPAAGQPEVRGQHINISIAWLDGTMMYFRVRRSTQWGITEDAACKERKCGQSKMRFVFDARRIQAEQTIGDLKMEDGDTLVEQSGD